MKLTGKQMVELINEFYDWCNLPSHYQYSEDDRPVRCAKPNHVIFRLWLEDNYPDLSLKAENIWQSQSHGINARLWILHPGTCEPVKVTLRPGQRLHWEEYRHHEEGWSLSGFILEREQNYVSYEWYEDGRDCDGRLERGGSTFCSLDRLAELRPSPEVSADDRVRWPDWRDEGSYQRDHAAEAVGY